MDIYQHEKLVSYMKKLPSSDMIPNQNLSHDQEFFLKHIANFWQHIAWEIDYFQKKRMVGYRLESPIESSQNLHIAYKKKMIIHANRFFCELILMDEGWDLIKTCAVKNRKIFPFHEPREMFAAYCKQHCANTISNITTEGINKGMCLNDIREDFKKTLNFYLGKNDKFHDISEHEYLQLLKDGDWFDFTIFAIWDNRNNLRTFPGLSKAWNSYLQSFKLEKQMICKKGYFKDDNTELCVFKWSQGFAVCAKNNKRLKCP